MALVWPNGSITFPFSGILTGYVAHPYHVSDLYLELSGVENYIGWNPLNGFSSITARITGIESGYLNKQTMQVLSPLFLSGNILSGQLGTALQNGFITATDWTSFNSRVFRAGDMITGGLTIVGMLSGQARSSFGDITMSGTMSGLVSGQQNLGSQSMPFGSVYSNQYATSLLSGKAGGPTTSYTVNWNLGSSQILDFNPGFSGNVFISFTNPIPGSTYALQTIQNPSGTSNAYFPSTAKWSAGTSGTMTTSGNAVDLFAFFYNGTNYLSSVTQNFK